MTLVPHLRSPSHGGDRRGKPSNPKECRSVKKTNRPRPQETVVGCRRRGDARSHRRLHRQLAGFGRGARGQVGAAASFVAPAVSCASLAGLNLTSNPAFLAQVTSAAETTVNGGDFCKVQGQIAPQEDFALLLPASTWTGNYLQNGNGGQGGSVPVGTTPTLSAGCMAVTNNNLAIGSDDEGHEGPGSLWAATDPAILSVYGYQSKHLLAMTAKALIKEYYGRGPTDSYLDGCSTGGRQGLVEAQRYPTDFQGILAGSPTNLNVELPSEAHAWTILSNTDSSGHEILTTAQLQPLHDAVMAACAVSQGVITDPRSATSTRHRSSAHRGR